jgi:DNA mismatch endonuclease (patch repair protein)
MAAIRGRDTSPELRVRRELFRAGFRFRLHARDLPGRPDIVLPRFRVAIFVHGCFWHGHGCARSKRPATNRSFWEPKLDRNLQRDRDNILRLEAAGWTPLVIWECTLKEATEEVLQRLVSARSSLLGKKRNTARASVGQRSLSS